MHFQHGAFYYVYQGKWTRLSSDYLEAKQIYLGLDAPLSDGLSDLIDRFLSVRQLSDKPLAAKTFNTYSVCARRLKIAFEQFKPSDFKPSHFYQWIAAKKITTSMASQYRNVMIGAMQLAVEEGLIDRNPIKEVKNYISKSRDRYISDGEFLAIYARATPTLKAMMDIAVMTGQRIGDVIKIKLADLTDDGIFVIQQKTKARLCIAWNPELRQAVATARALHQCVRGMTLFHTREGKQFSYWTIRTLWNRATEAAGVEDAHMHDLRAKAATDAKKDGIDSKALLGHKSENVHLRYIRDKETPLVQSGKMVKR